MTIADRAEAYAHAFPEFPASHLRVAQEQGGDCLYGTWLIGNDYRQTSALYGAYPPRYVDRVLALFPEKHDARWTPMACDWRVLHAFSGSLPKGPYVRLDMRIAVSPDLCVGVESLPLFYARNQFVLTLADPPYSAEDATKYGTPMVNRRTALAAIAAVTESGGHLVWLDCVWPMFSKRDWRTVGRICLIRSTNHRVRLISIFERQAA